MPLISHLLNICPPQQSCISGGLLDREISKQRNLLCYTVNSFCRKVLGSRQISTNAVGHELRLVGCTTLRIFAGHMFASNAVIDEQNIHHYLHQSLGELADRIQDVEDLCEECVIGWNGMNEPSEGFCRYQDLNLLSKEQGCTLKKRIVSHSSAVAKVGHGASANGG
jgi:hypothetical protein